MSAILDTELSSPQPVAGPPRNRQIGGLRWVLSKSSLALSVAIVALAVLWALVPGAFAHSDPVTVHPEQMFQPPSIHHWFGTDQLGRDIYSRVVHGARASLEGSGIAVLVAVLVGSFFGTLAGWFGGVVDSVIGRAVDVLLSIPGFLLAISIVVVLGFGITQAAISVGLTSSATFARLIRSEVVKARTSSYVEAATTSGAGSLSILWRHVVPNSLAPTAALVTIQFGIAIIWIASLSFLGLGAQPPAPEWGLLVSDGRQYLASRGWLTLYPGLTIVAVVLATNHIAHHIGSRRSK